MAKHALSTRKPIYVAVDNPQPDGVQPVDPVAAEGTPGGAQPPQPAVPEKILVIAREPIAELIDGEVRRFARGDTFLLDRPRAIALGSLLMAADID